jgi:hypothetical protein
MGQPPTVMGGYSLYVGERQAGELKHLSTPRKRNNSRSSGERTGKSPNQPVCDRLLPLHGWCCKTDHEVQQIPRTVTNPIL